MSQELETIQPQAPATMHFRDKIETIKQTVAKGASDAQLEMFLTLAERYQLDPFLKEIWFSPEVGIMTGRDGYLKVAQRSPEYDGIVSAAVCEGDAFVMKPMIPDVQHEFGAKRGAVIGAYAVAFHKGRRPAVCYAPISEYLKGGQVWQKYRSAMICKVAEVLALKRQFGISGLVTEEEVGSGGDVTPLTTPARQALHDKTDPVPAVQNVAPDVPEAVQALYATMLKQKKDGWAMVFNELYANLCELLGDVAGPETYSEILGQHGVQSWQQFTTLGAGKKCVLALYNKIQELGTSRPSVSESEPVEGELFEVGA